MPNYVVNNTAQANGDHEVHTVDCRFQPHSKTDLGWHASCHSAVLAAKKIYWKSNGCFTCSRECNTG